MCITRGCEVGLFAGSEEEPESEPSLGGDGSCNTGQMSTRRRLLGFVLLFPIAAALVVGFGPRPAAACSCQDSTLAEYADEVALAFTGEQTARVVLDEMEDNGAVLTFEVDQVFKGDVGETISVRTHAQGSACGMDFSGAAGSGVAVFTWRDQLSVSLCGSAVSVEELESVFGDGVPPVVVRSEGSEPGDEAQDAAPPSNTVTDDSTFLNPMSIAIVTASGLAIAVVAALALARARRS